MRESGREQMGLLRQQIDAAQIDAQRRGGGRETADQGGRRWGEAGRRE
jgi:hypothetical protein